MKKLYHFVWMVDTSKARIRGTIRLLAVALDFPAAEGTDQEPGERQNNDEMRSGTEQKANDNGEKLQAIPIGGEGARKHQRDDGHQLDQDVERRATSVLEWVTDRVTRDGRLVHVVTLLGGALLFLAVFASDLDHQATSLDVLEEEKGDEQAFKNNRKIFSISMRVQRQIPCTNCEHQRHTNK